MTAGVGLVWDLFARDQASPGFLKVAGAADKAAVSTERATKAINSHVASMGAVGAKLTKSITLPLLGIAAVSVDQAAKFQKSMTLIQTAGGETAAKTAIISAGIKRVAVETGTSLGQLGEGIYTVAKAGGQKWSATEQLGVLKAAAQGAKAENVDLGTAVSALTSVMMSYHIPASRAVAVQNELIVGAGRAKTTMQEYAGSLSTVIPVASAAGISFDQVAGAIATLTQHGTSAQEATQELAFTIRNLQAPNNVAVKAMQQLGLNVTNVEKNLGKRGLTGTIDLITNAIRSKMGPSGLVAVNAFKQSQSASADLQVELSKMPKSLASISSQFESGKLSYKGYYTDVKNLGGAQFELGKNFIATMGQAKGFNDLLKAGNPQALTFAAYLKQVTGGATGLNTALQLGGENLGYFKKATKDVGDAANGADKNVLGWSKTSGTLAFKIDQAKAAVQVFAVNAGSVLLPVVTKLAGGLTGAIRGFEGLSHTQKEILGWSAVVLAGIGPVLSIGARLGSVGATFTRFTTGVVNQSARFSSRLALNAGGVASAMGKVNSAIGGAAVGVAVGSLTANSSTAVKAIGVLGSAATGAAIGFGAGGGIGALVGGLAGGLSALATQFFTAGDSAKKQIPKIQGLTQALQDDNDQVGKNTEALVANSLQSNGLYTAGLKLGISQRTLTLAAEGNRNALIDVNAAMTKVTYGAGIAALGHQHLTKAQSAAVDASLKLSNGLGDVKGQLASATGAAKNIDAGLGKTTSTAHGAASSLAGLAGSAKGAGGLLNLTKGQAAGLSRSLGALAQPHPVNVDTSQAMARLQALLAAIPTGTFHFNVLADKQAQLVGRASGGGLPEGVSAVGEAGPELAVKQGSNVHIVANGPARGIAAKLSRMGIRVPGFASGTANSLASFLASLGLSRAGIAGVFGNAQIESGLNLNAYNAGENAHGLFQWEGGRWTALQALAKRLGVGATSKTAQFAMLQRELGSMPGLLHTLRTTGSASGAASAFDQIFERSSGSSRGARESAATSFLGQLTSGKVITSLSSAQSSAKSLAYTMSKIKGTDVLNVVKAVGKTVADTKSAFATLFNDLARTGAPSPLVRTLTGIENVLVSIQTKTVAARSKLTAMTGYQSGIRSTLQGAFDPTKYGSVADLITGLHGAAGVNNTYAKDVNKLRGEARGNANLLGFINTIAASGDSATLHTLASGSRGQLSQVNKAVLGYNNSVIGGGDAATAAKYGSSVAQQTHLVNTFVSTQNKWAAVVGKLAAAIGHQKVELHVDGKAISAHVVNSHEMNRLLSELEHLLAKG